MREVTGAPVTSILVKPGIVHKIRRLGEAKEFDMKAAQRAAGVASSVFLVIAMVLGTSPSFGDDAPAPKNWTAAQDHQNMMEQLGIKVLRPGPSGKEDAPNHANYDESKANPFPNLPGVLTTKDGRRVTTAEMWWKERRPEIVEDFDREVLGRVPVNVPVVTWTVVGT